MCSDGCTKDSPTPFFCRKVEEGSHAELLSIPVAKAPPTLKANGEADGPAKVLTGFYHNMWDTQMGEDS